MDKRIENIKGYLFPEEEKEIERSALEKNDGIIVEIGSYLGRSTSIIASSITSKAKFFAIDTWENDAMTEGKWDTFETFKENVSPWKENIIPIRGTSHDFRKFWNLEIDLLFIDGDHSYESVKQDLNDWYCYVKPGGILLMHDYTFKEGVQKACEEFFKDKNLNKKLFRSLLKIVK